MEFVTVQVFPASCNLLLRPNILFSTLYVALRPQSMLYPESERQSLTDYPQSAVLLEKLAVPLPLFYGIRSFITIFTRVSVWSPPLSQLRPVHILPYHLFEIQFCIILPSALFVLHFRFSSQQSPVSAVFHSITAVKMTNQFIESELNLLFVYCKSWPRCSRGSSSGSARLLVIDLMLLLRDLCIPVTVDDVTAWAQATRCSGAVGLQWLRTEAVLSVSCSAGLITVSIFQGTAGALQQLLRVVNTIANSLNAPLGSCDLPDAWRYLCMRNENAQWV